MDSRYIEKKLHELREKKLKEAFFESVMNAPTAITIHEAKLYKTKLFQGSKGPKTNTWKQTKKMAFELNQAGIDVVFLSEIDGLTCADAILKIGRAYRIADFKYCVTVNPNTIAKELEHGFIQASTIVLKLVNMDAGVFRDAIDYLLRNKIPHGDIVLLNKYGKVRIVSYKDIKNHRYSLKIKGFL